MEEHCRLTKTIPGLQAAVSLMLLNKNLLLSTLGSQITIDAFLAFFAYFCVLRVAALHFPRYVFAVKAFIYINVDLRLSSGRTDHVARSE